MIRTALAAIMIFLLGGNMPAFAERSAYPDLAFDQAIGLINIPTANLGNRGNFCVSLNSAVISVTLFDYFQIGLLSSYRGDKVYCGNMLEVKLIDEESPWPAIAVGGESLTEQPHAADAQYFNSSYVVASRSIGIFGTGHLGAGNGRFVGTGGNSSNLNGIFCGIEKTILEGSSCPVTLKFEEDGRDVNFGVEISPCSGLRFHLTVSKLDNWIYQHPAPDNNPTVSVGFCLEGALSSGCRMTVKKQQ